jgi:hypothetical protein
MEILKKSLKTAEMQYPEIMTVEQVAEYLGCSERHCHTLVKSGVEIYDDTALNQCVRCWPNWKSLTSIRQMMPVNDASGLVDR